MKPSTKPLAWNKTGNPLEVEDDATHWQVRRVSSSEGGGRPSVVYGEDGPLFLDIDATLEDLRRHAGPGRYRLDQVDETCQKIGEHALAVVSEPEAEPELREGDVYRAALESQQRLVDGLLSTVRDQQRSLAKALETQSSQLAAVMTSSARVLDVHNGQGISELVDGLPERLKNAAVSGDADGAVSGIAEALNGPLGVMLTSALKAVVDKVNAAPAPQVGEGK